MRETKINNCVPLSSAMLITDLNGVLSGHKENTALKLLARRGAMEGQYLKGRIALHPSLPLLS